MIGNGWFWVWAAGFREEAPSGTESAPKVLLVLLPKRI